MSDSIEQAKLSKSVIAEAIKYYEARQPGLRPVMSFYREVFGVQKKHSSQLPAELPRIDEEEMIRRLEAGTPLLGGHELPDDYSAMLAVMEEIAVLLEEKSPEPPAALRAGLDQLKDAELLASMAGAYMESRSEDFAAITDRLGWDDEVAGLLVHTSLTPFMWRKAGGVRVRVSLDQVLSGTCPVCGAAPIMGFLRADDGMRILECSLCGSRWGTPRMACPFCHLQESERLRYHFIEGDEMRRIYVCDGCQGYLKVTGQRGERGELVIPLEDMATAQLDAVAEERGYIRKTAGVFG
ncbi:MAG: formate dehydrogenase accessory protein FdhE [Candidatus Geothermincolia bacterium]